MNTSADLFSLWLLLPPDVSKRLRQHINRLSELADSPRFEPHITIASDLTWEDCLEIEHKASILNCTQEDTLRFDRIAWGERYFQSIYLPVRLPAPIAALREEAFAKRDVQPDFPPHISVAYGAKKSPELGAPIAEIEDEFSGLQTAIGSFALVASSENRPISQWKILRTTSARIHNPD
ncbi:2'-5' RNA ligase family protein [Shimia marina]|uniref:Cyclic phosphodiesterase-like protein n=1 Tax=Shimia marina TaxID=321267 RepID=A0A0P1EPC6_9RHOB|nr:2'-5' RNA ligase family protein [Shimia marina]CUH52184.1 Cyclic phosphodiesterase-like protein [Shimia marina]SFE72126.1 Cyclic phosphodiesterase-like protein [Shimia marina]